MFVVVMILFLALPASLRGDDAAAATPAPRHEEVIVTGTYEAISLDEADRSVMSLDVRNLSLLSNTWTDFLQLDPSLDLQERAPNGVQSDLSIRGGTFGQTLVLLNGLRLNDVQSGHHNLNIPVPLEAVSRIEVLHGAGSTQYGSDAVGGVVNFITEAPDVTEFRLRGALGNFGVNQERGSFSASYPRVGEQLVFSRDFSTGFAPDRDYRNLLLSSITHTRTKLGSTNIVLGLGDQPFGADQFYGNFNSWERTKSWFASLRQELGTKTEADFAFRRHTDLFVLYRDRPEVFTNRHAVESYQAAVRRHEDLSQSTRLSYGLEGYEDSIVSNNLGNHSRMRGAGYVNLDVRALRRFSFSIGGREEVYGSFDGEFSPTVSAGLWVNRRLKLRAGASRAFRIPSYTDLYYHDPANVGNPNLRPEKAWSYEGGLDWNAGGRVKGQVTVFQRRERDGIDYVRSNPTDIWRAANIHSLHFTGVEAGVTTTLSRSQTLDFRFTGLHGAQEALQGQMSRYVFNYPSQMGLATWQGQIPGGLIARTRIGVTRRYARSPYGVWDLYASRSRGRVHPFLQFTNLSDTRYEEVYGVAMPGRAVVGGLEVVVFSRKK